MKYINPFDRNENGWRAWETGAKARRTAQPQNNPYEADTNIDAWNDGWDTQEKCGPANPYTLDTEEFPIRGRSFWEQGFEEASDQPNGADIGKAREEASGYAAPDNIKAWRAGFDTFNVIQEENDKPVFNVGDIDLDDPDIGLAYGKMNVDGTLTRFVYPVWIGNHEGRPAWLAIPAQERRIITFVDGMLAGIVRSEMTSGLLGGGEVELPCPPYEYTMDGAQLRITAGAFTKAGAKDEWQEVIDEMQSEVDNIPTGIALSGIEVPCTSEVSVTVTHDVDIAELLEYHDNMDGTIWTGDASELVDALNDESTRAGEEIEYGDLNNYAYSLSSVDSSTFDAQDVERAIDY